MDFFVDHIETLIILVVNLVVLVGSYYRIRAKVDESAKEISGLKSLIHNEVQDIEETRLRNVAALREIYDAKVSDAKQYAKGLYELRESELRELGKRIGILEIKFDKQAENINFKMEQLIKATAVISAHLKIKA